MTGLLRVQQRRAGLDEFEPIQTRSPNVQSQARCKGNVAVNHIITCLIKCWPILGKATYNITIKFSMEFNWKLNGVNMKEQVLHAQQLSRARSLYM